MFLISPKKSRLRRFLAQYALRHAAVVTTVAEHMTASVVDLGVSGDRVVAIPFGVDTSFFVAQPHGAPNNETLRLICTRNLGTIYDVQTLVRALALLGTRGYHLDVDLVGDGPLRRSLVELVNELGLRHQVRFHGHVDPSTLVKLLAAADIFVSPALSDGNNVSLNEAMACGCYPIATDIPANAQWIQNGENGYLYPPGDVAQLASAIEMAIENTSLRTMAKAANRSIIEARADWRVCVKQMELVYERLSGKRLSEA